MKKETFIKLMTELLSLKEDERTLQKEFRKIDPDFNYIRFGRHEDLIVHILKEAMDDKNEWIYYWLYELECGTKAIANSVTDKDGKKIPLKTLGNLYDLIKAGY